ncbi:hypothetical protein HY357_00360 [Candidatus Roizmanbacteria bacterium]|nr:hypothetical protein [Candidatus Roizmanbacteria bacterium]
MSNPENNKVISKIGCAQNLGCIGQFIFGFKNIFRPRTKIEKIGDVELAWTLFNHLTPEERILTLNRSKQLRMDEYTRKNRDTYFQETGRDTFAHHLLVQAAEQVLYPQEDDSHLQISQMTNKE